MSAMFDVPRPSGDHGWRAWMLAAFDYQLRGLVERPRMYAGGSLAVLEALFLQSLGLRHILRCPSKDPGCELIDEYFCLAAERGVECGNTLPAYAAPYTPIDVFAGMLAELWKRCDAAFPMEEM